MNVNFYRAADAFLYLPTYIAENRGIYEQIDKSLKVKFDTPGRPDSGDLQALRAMIDDSRRGDTLSIALCDPFVMFGPGLRTLNVQPTDLRVLGAIITKVPFWAIDSREGNLSEEDFGKQFQRIIYYNEKLRTGNYIGARTAHLAGISDIRPVYFGQEFETLFNDRGTNTLAVTCDVVSMGLLHDSPDTQRKITVNHCYANNPHYTNFLTTALVTTAEVCKKYPEYTANIIQGIQAALGILRCSRDIALSVCLELAEEDEFYGPQHFVDGKLEKLNHKQVGWMIDRIYDGDFYPSTLEISKTQWEETLESHAVYGFGRSAFEMGKTQYETIVDPSFLLEGQRKYLHGIGVSLGRLVSVEIESQNSTVEELVARRREEEFNAQRPAVYLRRVTQAASLIGALMALTICFSSGAGSLLLLIGASVLVVCYPVHLIGSFLRSRINFLNRHTILWVWTVAFAILSGLSLYMGYLSNDSSKSGMLYGLSGLFATVAAVPLSILATLKLQLPNEK